MGNLFHLDSPLIQFLNRLADLVILNVLFLVCCIPFVTIGASWTAMSYVLLKIVRNEESYIVRSFFKSFRQNFRQATVIWLITLAFGVLLFMDFRIVNIMDRVLKYPLQISLMTISLLAIMTLLYVFPVLSKFENTIFNILRNAFLMAIGNLPRTLAITVLTVGCPFLMLINSTTLSWGILVCLSCGFSLVGYLNAMQFVKIFDRYLPKEDSD